MNHPERGFRRITSIPPRTSLDVLRGGVTIRIGGDSLLGGTRRVSREPTAGEPDWSQIVAKHVFQKPPGREKARPEPLYEMDRKIEWEAEVIEDYNGKGDLGIILQFAGIGLTEASFLRGRRYYGPDVTLFYSRINYQNKRALLILATERGIFESQVVLAQKDINPFFQEKLYLPQLTATHDPTSMTVFQNNKLVTVGYNPRTLPGDQKILCKDGMDLKNE